MATLTTTIFTPNTSGAGTKLAANLIAARDAMREDGMTADVISLVGGGAPGEMGLGVEYADGKAYAEALSKGPGPAFSAFQEGMTPSDSKPSRQTTWIDLPGHEVVSADLPRGCIQATMIRATPGHLSGAVENIVKAKSLMTQLGGKVRIMSAFLTEMPGLFNLNVHHESPDAWYEFNTALWASEEWRSYYGNPINPGASEMIRRVGWMVAPQLLINRV